MCWAAAANLGWKGKDAAMQIRSIVVEYMRNHEAMFKPFVVGENYQSYLRRIAVDREYLTEVELLAVAEAFGVCIELVYRDVDNPSQFYGNLEHPRWIICYEGNPTEDHRNVNHYNTVLPVGNRTTAERRPITMAEFPPLPPKRRRGMESPEPQPASTEPVQRRRQMKAASERRRRQRMSQDRRATELQSNAESHRRRREVEEVREKERQSQQLRRQDEEYRAMGK
jgi:hypothetical protein